MHSFCRKPHSECSLQHLLKLLFTVFLVLPFAIGCSGISSSGKPESDNSKEELGSANKHHITASKNVFSIWKCLDQRPSIQNIYLAPEKTIHCETGDTFQMEFGPYSTKTPRGDILSDIYSNICLKLSTTDVSHGKVLNIKRNNSCIKRCTSLEFRSIFGESNCEEEFCGDTYTVHYAGVRC